MDFTTAASSAPTAEKTASQPQSPITYNSSSSSSSIIPMDQSQLLETSSNQSTTNNQQQQQNHEAIASSSCSSPTTPKMTVSDMKLSTTLLEDFTELPANEIEKKCSICM